MARQLVVTVESTCISSGYCRNHAPAVFGTGPARKSVVLSNPVEETPEVTAAMESCPVEAISAVDTETGDDVFP